MKVEFQCTYCGHKWVDKRFFTSIQEMTATCPICNDKKVRARDANDGIIDGYVGCPPFKEVTKKDEEFYIDVPDNDHWSFD